MNDDFEKSYPYFTIKGLTIRDCIDKGIERVYDPNWKEKNSYLKLHKKFNEKYSPWIEFYSEETQELLGVQIPQHIFLPNFLSGLDSICLEYNGPISKYDKDNPDCQFVKDQK